MTVKALKTVSTGRVCPSNTGLEEFSVADRCARLEWPRSLHPPMQKDGLSLLRLGRKFQGNEVSRLLYHRRFPRHF